MWTDFSGGGGGQTESIHNGPAKSMQILHNGGSYRIQNFKENPKHLTMGVILCVQCKTEQRRKPNRQPCQETACGRGRGPRCAFSRAASPSRSRVRAAGAATKRPSAAPLGRSGRPGGAAGRGGPRSPEGWAPPGGRAGGGAVRGAPSGAGSPAREAAAAPTERAGPGPRVPEARPHPRLSPHRAPTCGRRPSPGGVRDVPDEQGGVGGPRVARHVRVLRPHRACPRPRPAPPPPPPLRGPRATPSPPAPRSRRAGVGEGRGGRPRVGLGSPEPGALRAWAAGCGVGGAGPGVWGDLRRGLRESGPRGCWRGRCGVPGSRHLRTAAGRRGRPGGVGPARRPPWVRGPVVSGEGSAGLVVPRSLRGAVGVRGCRRGGQGSWVLRWVSRAGEHGVGRRKVKVKEAWGLPSPLPAANSQPWT